MDIRNLVKELDPLTDQEIVLYDACIASLCNNAVQAKYPEDNAYFALRQIKMRRAIMKACQ